MDRVDILYLHDPERHDFDRGLGVALPAMAVLRDEGAVDAIGVGSMDTAALLAASESGIIDLLMVAGRYTLAEQPIVPAVVDACIANGVTIVNASVFNSGLLATDHPESMNRYDYGSAPAGLIDRVIRIRDICHDHGVDLPTAALHFAARGPAIGSVVIAGSRAEQITQNVDRLRSAVPDALWADLAAEELVGSGER